MTKDGLVEFLTFLGTRKHWSLASFNPDDDTTFPRFVDVERAIDEFLATRTPIVRGAEGA